MSRLSKNQVAGWLAVTISTLVSCWWAWWGIIENFHEGWFHPSLLSNLGLMFAQYLSPLLLFVFLSLVGIAFPRVGGAAHALAGIMLVLFLFGLNNRTAMMLIIAPMALLGTLYWFGRAQPRHTAYWITVGVPMLTLIVCGVEPVIRLAGRVNDGNLEARLVERNGVRLVWAAEGNGWTRDGVSWHEAVKLCQYLKEDGRTLADVPQNVWHLPTTEEVVRSMSRHGVNSEGVWNAQTKKSSFRVRPDKESPLWNIYSPVIYWWTASEADNENAYMIAYDGKVWPRRKQSSPAYLGYRCVKSP